ncbi:MAG TPA: hypothetical protein VGU44_05620, partial [Gammaproteobacteria bacterium]|nr:hypothetical protein [Gammaproteobacteria bacterium]
IVESTKTLVADLKETLENQVSGRIISKENLVLKSETIQNSGKVRAEGSATCEAGKIIQTLKSSEMRSEKQLLLDAKTKVENAGVLYGKESANITAGEVLTNKPDANLETNGMLTVATPFLDNAAKIKGQTMTSAGMAKLNNQGDVVFQESLKLGKIGVVENTGSITTPGSLYLETRLLQHTETAELSATTGVLTLQGDNYNAGKIITQDVILKTGSFENTITGILQAETLNATAANIDNAGKIQSKESFSVSEASFVKNKKGGLLAANNLTLSAITLENQGDLQGDTVAVTTTTRLEQEGTVTAETLTLTAPGIENHSTGVVKATQLTLNSVEVVNAGALKAKNLLLPQTKHLQNRGDINVDALNATLLQQLDNHATITIAEKGAVVSVQLNNRGVFKGGKRSHVKIQTRRCENQGELVFGTLGLDAEVLKNLGTGKILAEKLDANIKEVNNQGILGSVADCTAETLTLGGVANITASQFNNSGTLLAGDLICNTQNETGLYGFNNQGIVRTKAFHFTGKGISHTAGSLTVENMVITGRNIQLIATTESPGNIKLQHEGGIWEISDKHVKCSGELIFYWPEGRVVTQSWDALGSLKYSLSAGATQPLSFMANQTAETGHFSAVAPTPIIVGAAYQVVDATLRPSTLVSLIGKTAILKGSELQVPRGIVIGIEGVVLESQTDITLGQLYGSHSKTFPELASIQSAVKSRGEIVMKANNNHHWFQLEMEGGADFRLTGQFLDNVSSDIVIKNDAYLDAPLSQHRLLVDRDPGGYRVSWGGWNCHDFYKTQNASAKPLSNPAKFSIGGTLSYTGKMKIFGSQASCSVRVGSSLPELENFIPFTSFTE